MSNDDNILVEVSLSSGEIDAILDLLYLYNDDISDNHFRDIIDALEDALGYAQMNTAENDFFDAGARARGARVEQPTPVNPANDPLDW